MLSACSAKTEEAPAQEASEAAETEAEISDFVFVGNDTAISMHQDMAELLDALGETTNYAESPSCAFEGIDKIYSYKGFDVYTYPDGNVDRVNAVYFTDDATQTPKSIHIGSTVEEMEAAYGSDYTEEWEVYTYTDGTSSLAFVSTDGVIESVEYTAVLEK